MSGPRPTLSACILARSTRSGLERLLRELAGVADQVVVGVDEASRDDTFDVACRLADVVFHFEHVGPPVRARLLPLRHATGDWVLALDEDEGLDSAAAPLLHELLSDGRYSHYWLSRKWIVGEEPLVYLHGAPWFPDWQLRLFRNDPRRVWHSGRVHTGYLVAGPGCWEERTAILHYERMRLTRQEKAAKGGLYRAHGSDRVDWDSRPGAGVERRPVSPGPAAGEVDRVRSRGACVVAGVEPVPETPPAPPWRADMEVTMPRAAECGAAVLAEVEALNVGGLTWDAFGATWPRLRLSYHLKREDGTLVQWDGERFSMPRIVEPGERARFLVSFTAPFEPGRYRLEWDLVSEGECWFGEVGGRPAHALLRVIPRRG
jgi:Glycosyl transferase family 2